MNKTLLTLLFVAIFKLGSTQTNREIGGNDGNVTQTPINRSWSTNATSISNYSIAEFLYTNTEIGISGGAICIDRIAFYKGGGSTSTSGTFNTTGVSIYMKTVSATTIATGTYDLSTYTLVWQGTFPSNGAINAWKEVTLNTTFLYNNGANDHLQVLVLNNSGSVPANNNTDRPAWRYNSFPGTDIRSRFNSNATALPTFGGSSGNRPSIRIRYQASSVSAPNAITGSNQICAGNSVTLTATGGNATTRWYSGSCGGTQVGTGTSFTTPALNTTITYFAANEACNSITACASFTVNVTSPATAPSGITGNTAICQNTTTTLTATGGNANTKWFTGSCGGTQVGTGATYTTNTLNAATPFFAANEDCNGITACANITVNIENAPVAPSAIAGDNLLCENETATYSVINEAGVIYNWTVPAGWAGSSTTNEITVTANNTTGTISVTAENNCGISTASDLTIAVNALPTVTLDAFGINCTTDADFTLTGGSPAGGNYFIDGTPATTFDPSIGAGTYTVTYEYTDGNNCVATATQDIAVDICSGIENINAENILLFPNPTTNELFIKLNKGTYNVTLFDAVGKQLNNYHWQLNNTTTKNINTSHFSNGVYYINLKAENGTATNFKFIVGQ